MVKQEFFSEKELATFFGFSRWTIHRDADEMRKLIPKIYSKTDFCGTRIRKSAYQHYRNNMKLIKAAPKSVEAFGEGLA